jgi:hypothetical protein
MLHFDFKQVVVKMDFSSLHHRSDLITFDCKKTSQQKYGSHSSREELARVNLGIIPRGGFVAKSQHWVENVDQARSAAWAEVLAAVNSKFVKSGKVE